MENKKPLEDLVNAKRQNSLETRPKALNQVTFCELASGNKEVLIEHHGAHYRLLETRNGKLILNK